MTTLLTIDHLSVRIYDSENSIAQDAAQIVQSYLQTVISEQNEARIMLATGNAQIKFLENLIALGGIDWSKITFFHLDEYLGIDPNHSASFHRYLCDRVEKLVNPGAFHYIKGDVLEPLEECDRYAQLLAEQPIDLCCLGLGENGHIAFNDPAVANFDDPRTIKLIKLDQVSCQQLVKQGHFPNLESVPQYAFTITIPAICQAKKIICLAPEKRKAAIVKSMLETEISTKIPASILRKCDQATLFLDLDSAGLLEK